jgi:frataxin
MARQVRASSSTFRSAVSTGTFLARPSASNIYRVAALPTPRFMSTTRPLLKGILPETDDPPPSDPEPQVTASAPADLTMDEYHKVSDQYLEKLVDKFEAMQEEKEDVDCEYSV